LGIGLALVALATRTWIVQGLIVPVTVSSGSMAERILGPHASVTCRRCGYRFAIGRDQPAAPARVACPLCGLNDNDLPAATPAHGDQLLIDRTAVARGICPRRWQVVVFRCPDRASQYGAKRIVALPGESVAIRHGDVYINGQIARKELPVQRAVAQLVHRAAWDRDHKRPPRWRSEGQLSAWQMAAEGFRHRPADPATPRTTSVDWLGYHHLADQPVRDALAYNAGVTRTLHPVTDLMLSCQAQMTGAGQLRLQADDGRQRFDLWLPSHGGAIRLERSGRQVAQAPLPDGYFRTPRRLVLSLFDSQLLLAIDARVALRYVYRPTDRHDRPPSRPLAIGTRRLDVVIRSLAVWRDIYYTQPRWGRWAVRGPYQLGRDELFVLGDNSPISDDSRSWLNGGGLPKRLLVGTVVGVP
jgi:signal peptidase I